MNPLVVISMLVAGAVAAPGNYVSAGIARAGVAGIPHAGLGRVVATGPVAAVAPAPAAISLPGPFTTSAIAGPDATAVSRPAPIVNKQLHYGSQTYVAGYATDILKPPTPHLPIAVPTVLRGTTSVNPAIVNNIREPHVVNEQVPVPRRINVPYDVPVVRTQINEVPVPVSVPRAVPVPQPVPVQGPAITRVRQTAPIVQRTHTAIAAGPALVGRAGIVGHAGLIGGVGLTHGTGLVGAGIVRGSYGH